MINEKMDTKPCTKCLLGKGAENLYQTIREYVDSLHAEIKTPSEMYRKRLNICMECDNLINGMCRLCGCFVEARAAKINNYCAKSRDIW